LTLTAGTRLGPYAILAPLGAGGMGEVYRARDTRLEREVAIKVLPAELASDVERLRRFEKEARSASSLNHPNIVTIHDIGSEGGVSFIAMERVEGVTLRNQMTAGPLPVKRLLPIATQIADGLAKAHEAGIVHRDLKPENVMVTKEGLVKILDFGLAKLTSKTSGSGEGSQLPTMTVTSPGVVVGTVGYMSPEQASAAPLDFRSDQFALGSILYEMASGKRAFQRKTAVETLTAILNEEPEPLDEAASQVPAPLRWIVERCHSKQPEDRYVSTRDLARDLAMVRDHASEITTRGTLLAASARKPGRRLLVFAAVAALAGAGLAAGWFIRAARPDGVPQLRQVTFRRGVTGSGRFAPDGQTIVYAAKWDGPPLRVYTTRVDNPESRSLGLPPADVLSVSSSGELAIALERESGDVLATVPLSGGAPREILVGVLEADWRPGGTDLAVIRRAEGKVRLEYPIGKMLVESTNTLHSLHFSPRGDRLAYVESAPLLGKGSACVVELDGTRRVLELDSKLSELVWSRDGKALWVTRQAIPDGVTELLTLSLSGRSRTVQRFADTVRLYDSSSTGRLLVERVWFRSEIHGYPPGGGPEVALAWLDGSEPIGLSADGRMILLNEWARRAVFARPTDGGPAVRLGEGSARALSPDGKWALVSRTAPFRFALVPTGPGQTREFPLGTLQMGRVGGAAFLPEGTGAVFGAREPGKSVRSYRLDFGTGTIRPLTAEGTAGTCVSPDGLRLLVEGPDGFALQSLGADATVRRVSGLVPGDEPIRFASDGQVVFAAHSEGLNQRVFSVDVTNGSRKLLREFQAVDPAGVLGAGLVDLTPDARFWVHGYMRDLSDFYVIDGLP